MRSPLTHFVETRHKLRVADVSENEDRIRTILDVSFKTLRPNNPLSGPIAKRGFGDGEKFDSKAEFVVYLYYKKVLMRPIERNRTEWLPYVDENGKTRRFYPDFKADGKYLEVKGFWRTADLKKQEAHPEVVFVDATVYGPWRKEVEKVLPDWESQYTTF